MNFLCRHLMDLVAMKYCYGPSYFANVLWTMQDSVVRHFDLTIQYEDFQRAMQGEVLQFPTIHLHDIARALGM